MEAQAVAWELIRHDQFELSALEVVRLSLAGGAAMAREGDMVGAARVFEDTQQLVADLLARDVKHENPRHRTLLRLAQGTLPDEVAG